MCWGSTHHFQSGHTQPHVDPHTVTNTHTTTHSHTQLHGDPHRDPSRHTSRRGRLPHNNFAGMQQREWGKANTKFWLLIQDANEKKKWVIFFRILVITGFGRENIPITGGTKSWSRLPNLWHVELYWTFVPGNITPLLARLVTYIWERMYIHLQYRADHLTLLEIFFWWGSGGCDKGYPAFKIYNAESVLFRLVGEDVCQEDCPVLTTRLKEALSVSTWRWHGLMAKVLAKINAENIWDSLLQWKKCWKSILKASLHMSMGVTNT